MSINDAADGNGVRITNAQIFDELRQVRTDVAQLRAALDENIRPGVGELRAEVRSLRDFKADKTEIISVEAAIASVRTQTYAIVGGVLAGLVALRTLGVI